MQTWRAFSLVGLAIAGLSLVSPSVAAQQLPSPEQPGNSSPGQSFTQPPDVHVLETFKALKDNLLKQSSAGLVDRKSQTAPVPNLVIEMPAAVCTMIVVPVDSSLDPEFVKGTATDTMAAKMPVVQPGCRSTPQKR